MTAPSSKPKFYYIDVNVGNYMLHGTGETRKEALDSLWKTYHKMYNDFNHKDKWLEYQGLDEASCTEVRIGKGWVD